MPRRLENNINYAYSGTASQLVIVGHGAWENGRFLQVPVFSTFHFYTEEGTQAVNTLRVIEQALAYPERARTGLTGSEGFVRTMARRWQGWGQERDPQARRLRATLMANTADTYRATMPAQAEAVSHPGRVRDYTVTSDNEHQFVRAFNEFQPGGDIDLCCVAGRASRDLSTIVQTGRRLPGRRLNYLHYHFAPCRSDNTIRLVRLIGRLKKVKRV